jgi:hypothetical protein
MTTDTHTERDDGPDTAALRSLMEQWWQPPDDLISTLPKGGVALSYLGHADTTRALIEADPAWDWQPMAHDDSGLPVLDRDESGRPVGLWIYMTVCGRTIPAYGSCLPNARDAVKELIGDAIRNGAMRFGVAGALWSKADRSDEPKAKPKPRSVPAPAKATAKTAEQVMDDDLSEMDFDAKAVTEMLKAEFGADVIKKAYTDAGIKRFGDLTPTKADEISAQLRMNGSEVAA